MNKNVDCQLIKKKDDVNENFRSVCLFSVYKNVRANKYVGCLDNRNGYWTPKVARKWQEAQNVACCDPVGIFIEGAISDAWLRKKYRQIQVVQVYVPPIDASPLKWN